MPEILNTDTTIVFGLYGAGGFGREVMPLALSGRLQMERADTELPHKRYFVESAPQGKMINGYPLVSEDQFFNLPCRERQFNVAIADSRAREKLVEQCISRGAKPISIRSPHAIIYDQNELGIGAILCAQTIVSSNVRIGRFFHANIFSYVGHDCVIGDYVTFAPSVHCNGYVHINNHAYIGTGAIIKPGNSTMPLTIGEGAVVGMGAVVTKDVPPYSVVVGNPAKPLNKN